MTALAIAAQAEFTSALLKPDACFPGGLQAWNGSDPAARFAVHRNNVVGSLVGALADTFPVVLALVGEDFFRAMAAVFVRRHPPRSPLLVRYGCDFPDFIAGFEPARSVPYLADVARLEMARVHAFHAVDAPPLTQAQAAPALAAGPRVGELRLTMHPSVAVIASPYAIVSLWAAHQDEGDLATLDPDQAEAALVSRPALDVLVVSCGAGTAAFVQCLQRGADLAESAGVAAASAADFDLSATLSMLLVHGALAAMVLPQGDPS